MLAAGLLAVAGLALVGASRVGDDVDRLERAETLAFQLEVQVFEQAVLESRASATGAPQDSDRQRAAALRQETAGALAELTSLLPDDPDAAAIAAAAADWQAAVDTKLARLAAGDLVAANRVDRAQVDPRFEQLATRLRANAAAYDDAANTAQRRSQAGSLGVAGAAMALCVVLLWRVERARARQQAAEARAGEERSRLVNKILSVAERQRSGMAAELHDGPVQALTRLGILLERGRLRLRRGQVEDGLALFAEAQTALADEVQALRRIMATLRPPVLEERGLVSALCDYVEVVREQAGISCTLSAKLPERLPEDQEIVLYRVAQEALTNVARHSRASSARVELAGGTWTVWSREGSGTVLTATLPKTRVAA